MGIEIGKSSLGVADRIDFFKNLAGWLNAGAGRTALSEAVSNTCDAFSHDEYKTLRPKMELVKREVQGGQTMLYQALRMANLGFGKQELAIIEAAERSSQLRQSVPALVTAMEIQHTGKRELFTKLAGPLFMGFLLILMSLGVLIFMLPMVVQPVLDRNPQALAKFPAILRGYWHVSVWLRANPMIPIVVVSTPVILLLVRNTPMIKPHFLKFMLWWGPSRKIILGFNAVLVVYFMPALIRSGLPTYRVLQQLAECVSNPVIANQIRIAAQNHETGMRFSRSLALLPFRASFVNAVAAGESTGAIADRVQDLQEPYHLEMDRSIKAVVGVLKFAVMAGLLPFFIVSTYTALVGPIFALMEY